MALQYAVVAYVRNPAGHFVEELRRELYPEHAHLPAHVTVLPPRELAGSERDALRQLEAVATRFAGFRAELGEVENFFPRTPTVFLRVARAAYRFREMHDALNLGAFGNSELWPYMPHMTIVKMPDMALAGEALRVSAKRWREYQGERGFRVEELTFVREGEANHWVDIASLSLRGESVKV